MRAHGLLWASMVVVAFTGCASSTGSGDSSSSGKCSNGHASGTASPGTSATTTSTTSAGATSAGATSGATFAGATTGATAGVATGSGTGTSATTGGVTSATNGGGFTGATGGYTGTTGATAGVSGSATGTSGFSGTTGVTSTSGSTGTSAATTASSTTTGTTSTSTSTSTSTTTTTGTTGTTTGTTGTTGSQPPPAPDLLTSGAWNDNLNFAWYLGYLSGPDTATLAGLPLIPRSDRLEVHVVDANGAGLGGATVTLFDGAIPLFNTVTGASGVAYLFPSWSGASVGDAITINATANGQSSSVTAHAGDASAQVQLATTSALPQALDVAFVIDTTGSMGDELSYIAVEISTISARIAAHYPNVSQRWALVLYRDDDCGDEYELRTFDFSDLNTFQGEISNQSAGAGGDYEEEPEKGLAAATQLSWRQGNVARMVFHIADAPGHIGNENGLVSAIEGNARAGVKIFPVAASGLDARGEYAMRTEAEVTGGSYLFLTDDSHVGNSHEIPHIFCYVVTHLSNALVRMVSMELEGKRIDPDPSDIIRFVGNPDASNQCSLSDGTTVVML
ncbi:MAG: hypothetical protein JST54_12170 [Deltaproteobacteria bacterium]|nr:hypothetical protein [Deltaproteobacteria bacterium]